jgi:hypothetical protein
MTQLVEHRRFALKTTLRTGFIRPEISTLTFGALHGLIIAYSLFGGKHLLPGDSPQLLCLKIPGRKIKPWPQII